jgi:hypothetical protein
MLFDDVGTADAKKKFESLSRHTIKPLADAWELNWFAETARGYAIREMQDIWA